MFAVVEQKEPHVGRMAFADIEQPATFAERCTLAQRIRDELEVPLPIYVDGMDDASRALFSELPSPAFVIDRQGNIADKLPWADAEPLQASIDAALAVGPKPLAPEATWTLDQRDAFARRALATGDAEVALRWLDAVPDEAPAVPPTLLAVARAAITRCHALRDASVERRRAALATAREVTAAAWPGDVPRRLAALCELATLAAGTDLEGELWRAAQATLEPRAPAVTRAFVDGRVAATAPQTDSSARDRSGSERTPR